MSRGAVAGGLWPLREDLRSGDGPRRAEAVRVLGTLKAREARRDVEAALEDADLEVACRAAEALAAVGDPQALPALRKAAAADRPALADAAGRAAEMLVKDAP
jgi:HEAT repeat protein